LPISRLELRHPEAGDGGDFSAGLSRSAPFPSALQDGPAIALSCRDKGGAMSHGISYLIVTSCMIAGYSLIQFVIGRLDQRRQSRRIQEGIASYLCECGEKQQPGD
jgi:hypothetical protein